MIAATDDLDVLIDAAFSDLLVSSSASAATTASTTSTRTPKQRPGISPPPRAATDAVIGPHVSYLGA
jgi:hypothetical protein